VRGELKIQETLLLPRDCVIHCVNGNCAKCCTNVLQIRSNQICLSQQLTDCNLVTTCYTHPFNGHFSGTTRVSRYQKGRTNVDFTEARDSEWQWHQPGHMQVCTSLQTDNHASTSPLSFFTGRMPFLPPNQQRQSTEGISYNLLNVTK